MPAFAGMSSACLGSGRDEEQLNWTYSAYLKHNSDSVLQRLSAVDFNRAKSNKAGYGYLL
jgi:hypothetical protein